MKIGIIGGGRLGSCLGEHFNKLNLLFGILASTKEHSFLLAKNFKLPQLSLIEIVNLCDTIFITVPDSIIEKIATNIAKSNISLNGKCFFHCSGSLELDALYALKSKGANIGSIHPLQTFNKGTCSHLDGVYMAIDGDSIAKPIATSLVNQLKGIPFSVPNSERALYHATACLCSNYAVTIEYIAQNIFSRWMLNNDKSSAWSAIKPLFSATANNLLNSSVVGKTLTGPISRGDISTIEKHLSSLPKDLIPLYCSLGLSTIDLANDNGTIDSETAQNLKNLLRNQS